MILMVDGQSGSYLLIGLMVLSGAVKKGHISELQEVSPIVMKIAYSVNSVFKYAL